jgi:DNA-binding NtrC family response regulator
LETRGLKVKTAGNGRDAVVLVENEDYDLIILDLSMPGIGGMETLKRIKARQPDVTTIMLTGQGSIRTGIEAMKLGAEDFLQKPVNISELMDKIRGARKCIANQRT